MRIPIAVITIASLVAAIPAAAQTQQGRPASVPAAFAMANGEVRRVDKDAQKLTIRHGPLPELDMPQAMTMVYRVKDPAMLDKVKAGDKVRFHAENVNGAFVVTALEPAR